MRQWGVCVCVCKEIMEIYISEWASCTAIRCRNSQLEAFGTSSNGHWALRLHSFAQQKNSHPRFDIGSLQVSNMAILIGICFAFCTKRFWLKSAMPHKNYFQFFNLLLISYLFECYLKHRLANMDVFFTYVVNNCYWSNPKHNII